MVSSSAGALRPALSPVVRQALAGRTIRATHLGLILGELGANRSARLQARDNEPTGSPSGVDQLLGAGAGPRTQVGGVTFDRPRPDAHEVGRVRDKSAGGNAGGEDIQLARSRRPGVGNAGTRTSCGRATANPCA